jgi:ABC-type multidrug transport system ATPase subunit
VVQGMNGALAVESLSAWRRGRRVIAGLSFHVLAGEVVAVIGPNGAGKTSLLEATLGFLPMGGRVSYDGQHLHTLHDRARVFSYLAEDAEPPAEVRVAAVLRHAAHRWRMHEGQAEELVDHLELRDLATVRAGELSRGEKRRLLLFDALCTDQPVIVLDEPLGVFDPLQMIAIRAVLRARAASGAAVLLSVHQMPDAERIASRLLLLDNGRGIAFGSLAELRAQVEHPDASLEDIFLALLRRGGGRVAT